MCLLWLSLHITIFIFTILTIIINSIIDRLDMLVKISLCSCFTFTILTTSFNFIMDRLHILVKAAFCSYFIFAIIILMFHSIMDRPHMLVKVVYLCCINIVTYTFNFLKLGRIIRLKQILWCDIGLWEQASFGSWNSYLTS